ncbi:hypothetical protein QFC22_004997 [Naganishia vaughanmartiniae]|uniref:Uncharacterized protein n=1 Tax=Naganishia vaughanmartiniae TaxID=1424756 RepID=A0ACC2WVR1_9TREE|nr:hypothetical protein QFC22_004997 [Naganishia vaughanmartiniae]
MGWKYLPSDLVPRTRRLTTLGTLFRLHFWQATGTSIPQACDNETAVGDGVMLSCVPRESLFLTTKINNMNHKHVAEAMEESLLKLHTDYVDLVLMHWPVSIDPAREKQTVVYNDWTFIDTWREMENLVESGRARSIGVSNFGIQNFETLLASARIVPTVCRVESHVNCPSTELLEFCQSKGIHLTVYASLGSSNSRLADNGTLQAIARARNATIQQILLVWALKRGTSVIPKSVTTSLIKGNLDLDGIDLTCYEMHLLNSLLDRLEVCDGGRVIA